MNDISVACSESNAGWQANVRVSDARSSREYSVTVTRTELARLDPGASEPSDLVRRSFEFLLAREPKESILSTFGLSVIGHYYPDYEREITRK